MITAPMQSSILLTGLSGYAIIKNAIKGDYPIVECLRSMLPVADEVVVADCESDDGTTQMLLRLAATEPKIRVVSIPWPELPTYDQWKVDAPRPMNDAMFWPKLINVVRPMLRYQSQLHLDSDEILMPCSFAEIRKAVDTGGARWIKRHNFWKDAKHKVPPGWVCGENVARMGPSVIWMPSDEMHPEGEPKMRQLATFHESLQIGHYGFLRKQDGFYAKSKVAQIAIVGTYDSRLEEAERTGADWWTVSTFPEALVPFNGEHPACIVPWLKERGRL